MFLLKDNRKSRLGLGISIFIGAHDSYILECVVKQGHFFQGDTCVSLNLLHIHMHVIRFVESFSYR